MIDSPLKIKFLKKKHLNSYLGELEKLALQKVDVSKLVLDRIDVLKEAAIRLSNNQGEFFQIPFEEKRGVDFKIYINRLKSVNSGKVYLWTDYSNYCGLLLLDDLTQLNLEFGFHDEHSGIMTLLAENLKDKLILDWSEEGGRRMLEIESYGENWGSIKI